MHSIGLHPRQPYTGRLHDNDPISCKLALVGQINPSIAERFALSTGRAVAGFGMVAEEYLPERREEAVDDLEKEDDVYGSGIFDRSGREGTVHADMGVFADHPSLPGYVGREVDFAVSKDIADIVNGAEVVGLPTGGMAYVERGGMNVGPLRLDDHNNPYVFMQHGKEGKRPVFTDPVRTAFPKSGDPIPTAYPDGGTVTSHAVPTEVGFQRYTDAYSATNPQYTTAFQQNMPALGATETGPSLGAFVVAGAIVGVAGAIFMGTIRMPKRRPARAGGRRRRR